MGSDISKDAHELANEKLSVLGECVNVKNSAKFEESTLEISKIDAYFGESERSFRFYPITFSSSFSSLPVLP